MLRVLRQSIAVVAQSAPLELTLLVVLTLISGAGPTGILFLNKILIDRISYLLFIDSSATSVISILRDIPLLGATVGIIFLNLLTDLIQSIINFIFTSMRDRVQGFVQVSVLQKVASFEDIAPFETPEVLNLIKLAEKGIQRMQQLTSVIFTTLNSLFAFLPSSLVLGMMAWWIPFFLAISSIPSVYIELKYQKQGWKIEENQASLARRLDLYRDMLISEAYAKELRLFQLQAFMLTRWKDLFKQIFQAMQKVRQRGTFAVFCWSLLSGLGVTIPYVYVINKAVESKYSLGDLALYAGLILQIRQNLYVLINNSSELYSILLSVEPIFQLLDLKPRLQSSYIKPQNDKTHSSSTNQVGIDIRNVSFSYPGNNTKIFDNLNLRIYPSEMIAIVGENGSGKTTLSKLLCRLYDPDQGKILWNGQDLREVDLSDLHSRIAVVMQDYAHFPASVRENVGFGNLPFLWNDQSIWFAIDKVGLTQTIEELDQRLETLLGKQLEDGINLSGGQWQRIAIARAVTRLSRAELLILDEPTSAVDPNTEYEIYKVIRSIVSGRITVVISHRLALAKLADRIIVLDSGKVVESGTHNELMKIRGHYYLMFTRQASSYQ